MSSAELYDPSTGRWSAAGSLTVPRENFVLVALPDGGALVAGGFTRLDFDDPSFAMRPTAEAERFHPETGRWEPAADMLTAAAGRASVRLLDGRILVAGGALTSAATELDATPSGYTPDTLSTP